MPKCAHEKKYVSRMYIVLVRDGQGIQLETPFFAPLFICTQFVLNLKINYSVVIIVSSSC